MSLSRNGASVAKVDFNWKTRKVLKKGASFGILAELPFCHFLPLFEKVFEKWECIMWWLYIFIHKYHIISNKCMPIIAINSHILTIYRWYIGYICQIMQKIWTFTNPYIISSMYEVYKNKARCDNLHISCSETSSIFSWLLIYIEWKILFQKMNQKF